MTAPSIKTPRRIPPPYEKPRVKTIAEHRLDFTVIANQHLTALERKHQFANAETVGAARVYGVRDRIEKAQYKLYAWIARLLA